MIPAASFTSQARAIGVEPVFPMLEKLRTEGRCADKPVQAVILHSTHYKHDWFDLFATTGGVDRFQVAAFPERNWRIFWGRAPEMILLDSSPSDRLRDGLSAHRIDLERFSKAIVGERVVAIQVREAKFGGGRHHVWAKAAGASEALFGLFDPHLPAIAELGRELSDGEFIVLRNRFQDELSAHERLAEASTLGRLGIDSQGFDALFLDSLISYSWWDVRLRRAGSFALVIATDGRDDERDLLAVADLAEQT